MRILAKQAGHCTSCGSAIEPGQQVEWNRTFGARCLKCDLANLYPERANSRVEDCHRCGLVLVPGRGVIEFVPPTWRVRCKDRQDCGNREDRRNRA